MYLNKRKDEFIMEESKKRGTIQQRFDMISITLFSLSIFMFIVMMIIALSIDVMPSDLPYIGLIGKLLIYLSAMIQVVPLIIEKKLLKALILTLIIVAWIILFEVV
ncbi:hypothetical protein [Staphylococcus shinii]|uniref:hypothetical protein n=1 Tax=Staphylococcus shinii TaxID=2912228 RepID=UPI003F5F58E3